MLVEFRSSGFRVWGLGLRALWSSGFRVLGVWALGDKALCLGCRVLGLRALGYHFNPPCVETLEIHGSSLLEGAGNLVSRL